MGKDPAVLFYTSDFLAGTAFFTMEQRGQYITLLCEQHQLRSIPEMHLEKVCGTLTSPVAKKFIKDEDGTYYQKRMRNESEKRRLFCESRRESIKTRYTRSTHVAHTKVRMEDEDGNEDRDRIGSGNAKISEGGKGETKTWRNDLSIYQAEARAALNDLVNDNEWLASRETFHPNLNISLSLQKAWGDYWTTAAAWKNKKSKKTKDIDWKGTANNALSQKCNQVWRSNNSGQKKFGHNPSGIFNRTLTKDINGTAN